MLRSSFMATALLCLIVSGAGAATIHVPGDQPTIQAGLEIAVDGDTVLLACGTYNENSITMKSGVCLRSESGNPACATLEGGAPILRCDGVAATTHIEGIAFRGATQAIVCVNQSRPRFVDCDFVDNSASEGAAVFLEYSYPEFQRCRFTGNSASVRGACVFYQGNGDADLTGPLNFYDCEFAQNTAAGAAVLSAGWWRGPSVSFTDCLFAENVSTAGNLVATSTADIGHRSARFSYCSFLANSASAGLIETFGYDPHVEWCTAYGNDGSHFIVVNSIPPLGMSSGNITNTIIAGNVFTSAANCDYGTIDIACSDVFGNGGDWTDCISGQGAADGNLNVDPRLCLDFNPGAPLMLRSDSPCTAENNPGCGQIGAWPVGCTITATARHSWSGIKALY